MHSSSSDQLQQQTQRQQHNPRQLQQQTQRQQHNPRNVRPTNICCNQLQQQTQRQQHNPRNVRPTNICCNSTSYCSTHVKMKLKTKAPSNQLLGTKENILDQQHHHNYNNHHRQLYHHNHNQHDHHHQHHHPDHQHRSFLANLPGLHLLLVILMTGLACTPSQGAAATSPPQTPLLDQNQQPIIKIACLAPANPNYLFSLKLARPAVEIAVEKLTDPHTGILPNRTIAVQYADSMCQSGYSMHMAIEFYIHQRPHAFLGPVCDYGTAPVSRQARFWDIPVLSQAVARDFAEKGTEFKMLTRLGGSLNKVNEMFKVFLHTFKWRSIKIIYQPNGRDDIMRNFCHLVADGMQTGLSKRMGSAMPYYKFYTIQEALDNLPVQIGLDLGGKFTAFVYYVFSSGLTYIQCFP